MKEIKKNKGRLSQEEWLEEALKVLAAEGNRLLTVETLCNRLGVSRGSFYWHFKSKDEFLLAIIEFWEEKATTAIRDKLLSLSLSPQEKLLALIETIVSYKYSQFELPVRIWAMKEPKTKKVLQRIDRTRYETVRSLFEEMGYTGDELEMRTQSCVIYYNFMNGYSIDMTTDKDAILRQNKLRHHLLTKK